jgi:hypothetical protein
LKPFALFIFWLAVFKIFKRGALTGAFAPPLRLGPCSSNRLPGSNLGLGPVLWSVSLALPQPQTPENSRAVGLEGTPRLRVVRHRRRRLELPRARLHQRVQRGRLVDGVADPCVPSGLDVRGVVVVLGVLDPARAQGQLLVVLEELVARAVRANERAGLGVSDVLDVCVLSYRVRESGSGAFEGVPPSGRSSPASRSVCAQLAG